MPAPPPSSRALDAAVALASAALIALQVALMQALAQTQGHHFAFVVISLALLGFGSSGTLLALTRSWSLRHADRVLPASLLAAALGCLLGLPAAQRAAARTDFPLLFVDARAWAPVLTSAALAFLPFFFSALFLGLVFMRDAAAIGRRYAANLLGSAAGAGLGLGLLHLLHPEQAMPLLGTALAVAAVLAFASTSGRRRWPLVLGAGLAGVGLLAATAAPDPPRSAYKPIAYALQLPEARIVEDAPHPMGRIQQVVAPALRHAPGLSLGFTGEIPPAPHLFRNGDGYGAILPPDPAGSPHLLAQSVQALPLFVAPDPGRALVLHPGGGALLGHVLGEAREVDAVEPHPAVASLLGRAYPGADLTVGEGRAFLSRPPRTYDLILLPPQGAFGGGLGVQALQEDYLLTLESFRSMWRALESDGWLGFSVVLDQPPRQSLRLLALLAESLRAEGVADPARHVVAARSWDMLAVAAARSIPDPDRVRHRTRDALDPLGFDFVWRLGDDLSEQARSHVLDDDTLDRGFEAILRGDRETFAAAYPFRIDPPTDDAPYFHQFIRWTRLDEIRALTATGTLAWIEMGSVLVGAIVVVLGAAAFLLILAPLAARGLPRGGRGGGLLYFAGIGLGFMTLEILWIQRFTLYWGHSLYAAAGVIAALLCGMGAGSALSSRLPATPRTLRRVLGTVLAIIVLAQLGQPALLRATLPLAGPVRGALGLAILMAPAVALGMPFPLALRLLEPSRPGLIPWAWGVNGCFSVLAAPLAALLAMQTGLPATGWVAAGAYLVALLACERLAPKT